MDFHTSSTVNSKRWMARRVSLPQSKGSICRTVLPLLRLRTYVTPNIVVQYHEWAMVCGGEGGSTGMPTAAGMRRPVKLKQANCFSISICQPLLRNASAHTTTLNILANVHGWTSFTSVCARGYQAYEKRIWGNTNASTADLQVTVYKVLEKFSLKYWKTF